MPCIRVAPNRHSAIPVGYLLASISRKISRSVPWTKTNRPPSIWIALGLPVAIDGLGQHPHVAVYTRAVGLAAGDSRARGGAGRRPNPPGTGGRGSASTPPRAGRPSRRPPPRARRSGYPRPASETRRPGGGSARRTGRSRPRPRAAHPPSTRRLRRRSGPSRGFDQDRTGSTAGASAAGRSPSGEWCRTWPPASRSPPAKLFGEGLLILRPVRLDEADHAAIGARHHQGPASEDRLVMIQPPPLGIHSSTGPGRLGAVSPAGYQSRRMTASITDCRRRLAPVAQAGPKSDGCQAPINQRRVGRIITSGTPFPSRHCWNVPV